ncbi:MAG: DUF4445 domain-containing protein [Clostridia bacterium]|nr:DUF4445 domain-containing protein [Clostridia bacterium]
MRKVKINGKIQQVKEGTLLSDVLINSGISVEHPCAGRGVCKKCTVIVNGEPELACQYKVKSDITVLPPFCYDILSVTGANESGKLTENLCYALDIGTTTLALALVSLDECRIIKVITRNNPQRIFGADVISRIDYCRKNSSDELSKLLINEINSMISDFKINGVEKLFVSGNTTMLHLLFGVDCVCLGSAPYTPVFTEGQCKNADELEIYGVESIESLPSVAAFVGADIVAGLNYVGLPERGKYSLLVDLGTNAEIVLFSNESVVCTSAAAGPCFEGANISCGMSATQGAIYSYSDGEIKTVGNVSAKGICGTGLVDIIARLLSDGTIDNTGYMECETFEITKGVYITQDDVRQFQLAKSAVYSALITLLQTENVSFDMIDKMYISGGFSAKIKIENAVRTGLLPKELAEKCFAVNNSSLLGTVKYACEQNDLNAYIKNSSYIDLSSNVFFSDLFIENMMFLDC